MLLGSVTKDEACLVNCFSQEKTGLPGLAVLNPVLVSIIGSGPVEMTH